LAAFDGAQLLTSRWNLGALYLLPGLRAARLATFWTERERLRLAYLDPSRVVLAATGDCRGGRRPSVPSGRVAGHVADACLRALGVTKGELGELRAFRPVRDRHL
jgi:hypothetical protein